MRIRRNVGPLDRALRFGLGVVFIYLGFYDASLIRDPLSGALLGAMGVMLVFIAIIAWCPFYHLIGFNSLSERT
ncbi:MAG: hypothetical protein AMJ72_09060 [Acidithiobacillales bacterium SM1_46]|jgi:hypothetical protein|nr:MAG: hypothetical protein AMJ72_09060 [Acidithiobacillales bacterium SM1_46]